MKRLLGFVSDVRMRYKLATDLNFRDLGTSILEGDGGAFLRDVMVPWDCVIIIIIPNGLCEFVYRSWNEKENAATVGNHLTVPFKSMQALKYKR